MRSNQPTDIGALMAACDPVQPGQQPGPDEDLAGLCRGIIAAAPPHPPRHHASPRRHRSAFPQRWRHRRAAAAAAIGAAAVAAAGAAFAIVPAVSGGAPALSSAPRAAPAPPPGVSRPSGAGQPSGARLLPFTASVTGPGSAAGRQVRPGETLAIRVSVVIPPHASVTRLWLGISAGTVSTGKTKPVGMRQVLAYRHGLGAGPHTFALRWHVPAGYRPSARLLLVAEWDGIAPESGSSQAQPAPADVGQVIREFTVAPG